MTTKELADFFGKGRTTIFRAMKLCEIHSDKGVKKEFTKEEVEKIANVVFNKVPQAVKEAIEYTFGTSPNETSQPVPNGEVDRLARLEHIVEKLAETVAGMPSIMMQMAGKNQKQLPAVQELSQRDQLRQAVNSYASKVGGYREAWGNLYQQFYYRYHRNVKECAKNRGMDTLDYIEEEGLLHDLLALAIQLNA